LPEKKKDILSTLMLSVMNEPFQFIERTADSSLSLKPRSELKCSIVSISTLRLNSGVLPM
jgi:hypothetical protein